MKTLRIGTGAGFAGDRIEPAVELAQNGNLDYLVFECLAERTIALAQQARMADPNAGYDPLLERRMRAVLPICHRNKTRIISNMGAANPVMAGQRTLEIARELGLTGLRIAVVCGDDVHNQLDANTFTLMETGETLAAFNKPVISANAYLGAGPIVDALANGADIVLTGRVADPAMFLAPQIYEFGWSMDDWQKLGRGTLVGHLLECGGQITGGYFADPGVKDVPDIARLGFPLAEVSENGDAIITKTPGTGGIVSVATCTEQLLYEVHNPACYLQPDVIADFSGVMIKQVAPNRIAITGGSGHARTGTLKVSVGYVDSFIGEGQISYAGVGCVARGRLALDIVRERLKITAVDCQEIRCDLIGLDAVLGAYTGDIATIPEIRARFTARTSSLADAQRIGEEVESLYLNGPAAGGGVTRSARQIVGIVSGLIDETLITPTLTMLEV
ncbi:acyclic terpene utilization AtuA family protein [Thalassospira sp. MCCC 1A01428]|uniref:acyclic terpene utilization AtuA family protein n=1 Tax=Thalassospira sp. MCCC 1A01428 TaxID=1470575 RepID=UPI000A1F7CAA|nr:acyclic terpene utilization AtuA family protein [Thalassospira sp. MCCC 1A01428]OSQ43679.1 ABC transporter substrate-binding protein [Thalassospira sp. MCCC 1A01428]